MEEEEDLITFDGLDDAILGIASRGGGQEFFVYSRPKCIELLMVMNDWSLEDAEEYFDFNVNCLWAGDATPAILV
jgi:hypothetical protein